MFVDLDWPLNASSLLSASAELLVSLVTGHLVVIDENLYDHTSSDTTDGWSSSEFLEVLSSMFWRQRWRWWWWWWWCDSESCVIFSAVCTGILPINCVVDLKKLSFLNKQRTHLLPTFNIMHTLLIFFTQDLSCVSQRHWHHRKIVYVLFWDVVIIFFIFSDHIYFLLYLWLHCLFCVNLK